ncbi:MULTISPECIES: hypothetical protein [Streptomyces]|uniref:hypothetical protein n=1 Tax=Streptomyces TaxID=1883 RepID=UPI0022495950|nr:hypothetical protein [Streptomyces sp. JHD 1]MCX2969312.1 hypothetical protein [Streptomyces sp. JHD 1]
MDVAEGWTRISEERAGGEVVLAVDFPASGRREATFRDLARLLPEGYDVWHTAPLPGAERPDTPADAYLTWWTGDLLERRPPVRAVLGYCAGSMFAAALAELLDDRLGRRPPLVAFNPGPPTTETLHRDFRAMIEAMTDLEAAERSALHRQAADGRAAAGGDFGQLGAAYARAYAATYAEVFARLGVGASAADQLTGVFRAYLAYLGAARGVPDRPRWPAAAAVTSRDQWASAFCERCDEEYAFDVGREDLLRSADVAETVSALLRDGTWEAGR